MCYLQVILRFAGRMCAKKKAMGSVIFIGSSELVSTQDRSPIKPSNILLHVW